MDYVTVYVSPFESDIQADGLTPSAVKTDIELRLRQYKIPLESWDFPDGLQPSPGLVARVTSLKTANGVSYVYNVVVELEQEVRLAGRVGVTFPNVDGAYIRVPTWRRSQVGIIPASEARDIRDGINDAVDGFINDWLAVH
ncbi:MAG: hypothetical protein O2917_06535 [Acidobacteria bacterium]|nr:hypothetical protein [Acidobacteriota bacterium]